MAAPKRELNINGKILRRVTLFAFGSTIRTELLRQVRTHPRETFIAFPLAANIRTKREIYITEMYTIQTVRIIMRMLRTLHTYPGQVNIHCHINAKQVRAHEGSRIPWSSARNHKCGAAPPS